MIAIVIFIERVVSCHADHQNAFAPSVVQCPQIDRDETRALALVDAHAATDVHDVRTLVGRVDDPRETGARRRHRKTVGHLHGDERDVLGYAREPFRVARDGRGHCRSMPKQVGHVVSSGIQSINHAVFRRDKRS